MDKFPVNIPSRKNDLIESIFLNLPKKAEVSRILLGKSIPVFLMHMLKNSFFSISEGFLISSLIANRLFNAASRESYTLVQPMIIFLSAAERVSIYCMNSISSRFISESSPGVSRLINNLSISRMQRDLSDSSKMRNLGVIFAHSIISIKETMNGLNKVEVNEEFILNELDNQKVYHDMLDFLNK